jgi:16S rRNA (adenine1518-N6/adenine1519-N6)-dimethyltransferase
VAEPRPPRALLTPGRVRELLAAHDLRPSKALGQHYLADPNTARKVARLGGIEPGETVLEVGPGLGSLTLALREAGAEVVAVEADARLLPALAEVLGDDPGVRVEVADALRVDLAALAPTARRLVANLPYSIAASLVLKVLAEAPAIAQLVVMVQREVGERLAAAPGSAAYGAPSAKLAAQATARVLAPVSRHVFVPEPHVDSVLLGVTRRQHPALAGLEQAELGQVIDAAFGQRRKTLRNALRALGLDAAGVEALGAAAGVDLGLRAERLDVAAFAALAAGRTSILNRSPAAATMPGHRRRGGTLVASQQRQQTDHAPPTSLRARAAAKVNLGLYVGPLRDDGRYHEVVSVLQSIGIWDELEVEVVPEGLGLEVEGGGLPPDETNLVLVAARELARRSRDLPGARFRLRKGIPVSAGLGGGSADGAAALIALDRLWGLHLPAVNLHTMAAEVGSDVPFCIGGGAGVATGRGDKVREVPSKGSSWWVVGIDHERLATEEVYGHFDELGLAAPLEGRWPDDLLASLAAGDSERLAASLHNDLEPAAFDLLPALAKSKQRLKEAGALGAIMSGSGPTMLGLCRDEDHATSVARAVRSGFARVEVARGPVPGVTFG